MAFLESPRFPERISTGATGGPAFSTTKVYTRSGQRYVNKNWEWPLPNYNVAQPVKKPADFVELRAFFYTIGGSFGGFRFKDWTDFTDEEDGTPGGIFTLVTGSTYQMMKRYVFGAATFHRIIQKPVVGTVQVFRTRSAVTTNITGSSTIDTTTGRITVTGHVDGDTYAWTGEFDVPVALQNDDAVWTVLAGAKRLQEWPAIQLEGLRL